MIELQQQARALGDPTRHRIFRYVVDAGRGVSVAELTDHLGLNHNAIRQHLAKLVDAELLTETKDPAKNRGRPRYMYALDPRAESRWGVLGPYERLSLLLAEVVRTGDPPLEVGRRAGGRQRLGGSAGSEPVAELVDQMARLGFEPVSTRRGDDVEISLSTCPFSTAAVTDPDTVCALHLGMAQGLAEGLDGLVVDELVPRDPRRANCRLRCHVEAAPGC